MQHLPPPLSLSAPCFSCLRPTCSQTAGWSSSPHSTHFDRSATNTQACTYTQSCHPSNRPSPRLRLIFPMLVYTPHRHTHTYVKLSPSPLAPSAPLPVAHVGFLIRWMQELVLLSSGWRGLEGVLHTFTKLFCFSPLPVYFLLLKLQIHLQYLIERNHEVDLGTGGSLAVLWGGITG